MGFEEMRSDKLRGHMDIVAYMHISMSLGLLKCISDAFWALHDLRHSGELLR